MEARERVQQSLRIRKKEGRIENSKNLEILKKGAKGLEISGLIILILIFGFPFLWMISTSLKSFSEIMIFPPKWIPDKLMFENYIRAWNSGPFLRYFFNSVLISISILILQFATMIPTAYAFARYEFKLKKLLFAITLLALMIPEQITFLPVYLQMSSWNLLRTYAPLILPFAASGFGVFLLRQTFMQVPDEIIEAARLDNASEWKIMWKIMMPMARPVLITFALFSFISQWNSYFWPLVMTNTQSLRTLPIGVAMLKDAEALTRWDTVMAGNMILIAPMLVIYFFAQKQIIKAFVYSGIK
ncbi:carbohydrate ABC transporter membrane protein 2, CUT1 family [Anaerovirgula multivorans]|uniref:Carbohydrate ABC transporter membrane protein 2, CUT1 family n=1 Tax=Anaerovirgula multivorans TaxID=312168 RepID=A0A239EIF1_9FIRM|nr:carbohydrate ABC transporter permease [Anaerovirgula multivorans]SNS44339.1 carbohydrate ABC transporter membrane protein 2, CUT1 family [Anaerovirgula multivorans]